jgi:hypothetical protein
MAWASAGLQLLRDPNSFYASGSANKDYADPEQVNAVINAMRGNLVLSGGVVSEQTVPSLTVDITEGTAWVDGAEFTFASGGSTEDLTSYVPASSGESTYVILYADPLASGNKVEIVQDSAPGGDATTGNQYYPEVPENAVTLAVVLISNGDSTILNSNIADMRLLNPDGWYVGGPIKLTGQFTSTLATGTAPLVVASTTKVSNLNVDQVDGYDFDQALLIASSPTFAGLTLTGNLALAANSITGTSVDISNVELQQLSNIGSNTISSAQWGYLGALDQGLSATSTPTFASLTLNGNLSLGANSILGSSVNISNAELQQLSNIGVATISATQWSWLGLFDQNLRTTDSVEFSSVSSDISKAGGLTLQSTGNVILKTTGGTSNVEIATETDLNLNIDDAGAGNKISIQVLGGEFAQFDPTEGLYLNGFNSRLRVNIMDAGTGDDVVWNSGDFKFYKVTSSLKYKENIISKSLNNTDSIFDLQLKEFNFKYQRDKEESEEDRNNRINNRSIGYIAEEVEKIMPELVTYKDGEPDNVKYKQLVFYMIEEMKKLKNEIEILKNL